MQFSFLLLNITLALPHFWVQAAFADFKPALARAELDRGQAAPGETVKATYTFRSNGPSQSEMKVFVHVVRPDGQRFGADFDPQLSTTGWPADRFVQEGPQPIDVPEGSPPGKYRVLVGMFSPTGGPRVELANADRHQGDREYLAGEFEVLAVGAKSEAKPVKFELLAMDESKLLKPPPAQPGKKTLDRIILSIDRKVLRPVREGEGTGKLSLTGIYSDGSRCALGSSEAKIQARTKTASGNVEVVAIEGDKVVAKEGGVATIEAAVTQERKRLTARTDVVVAPYYRDYHQALVLKLFLGMEGQPVERLAKEPMFQKPHDVMCTFEEALEVIRKADNLTRGIPKIIYLVGWQKGGHDHGYPAWSEVNPRLKRAQDATALESLRWLIREGRKFNTTVSLHLNMADAYQQSPLWAEYVAKDCFAKDESGKLLVGGIQMKGEDMYSVVYPKEWEAGLAQRRIDRLIQLIPELKEGHTIHIDVFIANRDGGRPMSPWHAKPENGGLTPAKYVETQRKIFHYWRDRGFDVTGEGTGWAHPPGEHFVGLQAMSWWYSWNPMEIPECLGARGRTDRGGDGDFRFGSSMHGEEIWQKDKDQMPGFQGMFCRTTLPWYYLSRLERVKLENNALHYSDGVVARTEGGKRIIRKGDFVLREDDHLFVPALWNGKEIIAYSRQGYASKTWQLPEDWKGIRSVDLYQITMEGCAPLQKRVPVTDAKLVLSLGKDEAVCLVPAGAQFLGSVVERALDFRGWTPEPGNPEWLMRHREKVEVLKAATGKLDLLFLGDSITSGWLDTGKGVWNKEFASLRAVSMGIAGSQTSHLLWQIQNAPLAEVHPKAVFLMIGTNNLQFSPSQSAEDIARGISVIVQALRQKLPRSSIVLMGTFPRDRTSDTPHRRKIQAINAIIAKLDDGQRIRFLDIGGLLLDKDGNLTAEVSPDGVHLTEKGYRIWGEAIRPVVREMMTVNEGNVWKK